MSHVGLDHGADSTLMTGLAMQLVDKIERTLSVRRSPPCLPAQIARIQPCGFRTSPRYQFACQLFVYIQAHVGEFQTDIGV